MSLLSEVKKLRPDVRNMQPPPDQHVLRRMLKEARAPKAHQDRITGLLDPIEPKVVYEKILVQSRNVDGGEFFQIIRTYYEDGSFEDSCIEGVNK